MTGLPINSRVRVHAEVLDDVLEIRPVGVLPLEALLYVRVLVDDQRLERSEVGCRRGREVLVQRLLERGRPGCAERVVGRVRALQRREVEAERLRVGRQVDELHQEAGRPAGERAGRERHLGIGPVALPERRDRRAPVLRARRVHDERAVVVHRAVVRRVEDVDVPHSTARDLGAGVREERLLRGAERRRDVRPTARRSELSLLVLDAEAGGEVLSGCRS